MAVVYPVRRLLTSEGCKHEEQMVWPKSTRVNSAGCGGGERGDGRMRECHPEREVWVRNRAGFLRVMCSPLRRGALNVTSFDHSWPCSF